MSRQKVGSQLSAMNAATAQMVTLTSAGADDTDYTAVGSAVQTMYALCCHYTDNCHLVLVVQSTI